jgi:hypothetical protein
MLLVRNSTVSWIIAGCVAFGSPLLLGLSGQTPAQQTASSQNAPAAPSAPASTAAAPAKPKPAPKRKKKVASTPNCVPSAGSDAEPPTYCPPVKVVVRNGGTSEHALRLSGASDDARDPHGKQSTDQLLQSTGRNLQQLATRQLAPAEKEMVEQILHYTEQSRSATAAGDVELGHNFALKAHLLSDELLSH